MAINVDVTFLQRELNALKEQHDKLKAEEGKGGGGPPGGGELEKRIEKLESAIPDIREKLAKVEAKVDSIEKHGASKADVASLESTLIKWFVATAFAMTALASGVAFGIARALGHN